MRCFFQRILRKIVMEKIKAVVLTVISIVLIIGLTSIITGLALYFRRKTEPLKLVIDNDAGGDDAMAIFLALLYEQHFDGPKLVALTTGNGNTVEDNVCVNNQRILNVARREDIPIYRGSKSSLINTPVTNAYYGNDGLGDYVESVSNLAPPQGENAVLRLIELSKLYQGSLVVVTIGTLTNIALAIKIDPDFLSRLSQLYVAAGHIRDDEKHALPEFNAKMDVEAYSVIAQHATPGKVTVLPFSQTRIHLNLTKEWRQNVLGGINNDIVKTMNKYEQVALARPTDRWQSLDPSAVAIILRPDLVSEYKYSQNDIILCGDQRGINTNKFVSKQEANVRIIYSMRGEEYKQFLLDVFKKG